MAATGRLGKRDASERDAPSSGARPAASGAEALRVGIIGAGYIAREHLACLTRLADARPMAVCDLSPTVAEATAEMFGLPHWFTDHREMLRELDLDVVHVATPPASHVALARDALEAGTHVFVEKPIALRRDDFFALRDLAEQRQRVLVEDHNYLFNPSVQKIRDRVASGAFGEVVHVEASFCVPIAGAGSRHADPKAPQPFAGLPGGALVDFLTHLAYLSCAFVGAHRKVDTLWCQRDADGPLPVDELRVLVDAEGGTASLSISSHSQPDTFSLRVHGTRMRAAASLFEPLLVFERSWPGPGPLVPVWNGFGAGIAYSRSAVAGLWRKLSGRPLTYQGLWTLLEHFYASIRTGSEVPITIQEVENAGRLLWDVLDQEPRP